MTAAYFAPLVTLPVLIDAPGDYLTRSGERVTIRRPSWRNEFGCIGQYANGTAESWHRSGRLFAGQQSDNDITAKAAGAPA